MSIRSVLEVKEFDSARTPKCYPTRTMLGPYVPVGVGTADCQGQLRPHAFGISFTDRPASIQGTARGIREYPEKQGGFVGASVLDSRRTAGAIAIVMEDAAFFRIMPIPADEAGRTIQDRGAVRIPEKNQAPHVAIQPQEIALAKGFPFEVLVEAFGHAVPPTGGELPWRSRRAMEMG